MGEEKENNNFLKKFTENYEELWTEIQQTIKDKKTNRAELAENCGINTQTMNSYFRKGDTRRTPSGPNLFLMCAFLKINFNKIFYPQDYYEVAVDPKDLGTLVKEVRELNERMKRLEDVNKNQSAVILGLTQQLIKQSGGEIDPNLLSTESGEPQDEEPKDKETED